MSELINQFIAFNLNGLHYIIYAITEYWCLSLLIICAIISAILYLRAEVDYIVTEEQNIL